MSAIVACKSCFFAFWDADNISDVMKRQSVQAGKKKISFEGGTHISFLFLLAPLNVIIFWEEEETVTPVCLRKKEKYQRF